MTVKVWRLIALGLIALVLSPGTWLRDDDSRQFAQQARFVLHDVAQPAGWPDSLLLDQVWEIDSANPNHGGISALIALPDGVSFRGFSDKGPMVHIPRPDASFAGQLHAMPVSSLPYDSALRHTPDIEAAVQDDARGTIWLSYEYHNAIRRLDADGSSHVIKPPQMHDWGDNSGAEAMARLPDGRFVLLSERLGEGLLFASDPLDGAPAVPFSFDPPDNFRPTAMAQLPDGRMLILLRAIAWQVPPFATMMVIADPALIREGQAWPYEPLAMFDQADLRDNYEGMVIEPAGEGEAVIWLISDDNRSFLQRSLLLKLRFAYTAQRETARED